MKYTFLLIILLGITLFSSCEKEDSGFRNFKIEGLTMDNYPIIDCSTSAEPLNNLIACKLLGYKGYWDRDIISGLWYFNTDLPYEFIYERLKRSQTHNSIINLIDNKAELILSARKMSDDEKEYAESAGVTLIETPVALDAFIFITNKNNPINSLTITQIQDIYTAKIRSWKEVGGSDNNINPYIRNANSGSQELMESMVMKDIEPSEWPIDYEHTITNPLHSMSLVFSTLRSDIYGLGYTVYYYKEKIMRDDMIKSLSINGVYPDRNSIKAKSYPLVAEVYAVIRSDLDKSSMAYKIYELLQTRDSRAVIEESGYTPYN